MLPHFTLSKSRDPVQALNLTRSSSSSSIITITIMSFPPKKVVFLYLALLLYVSVLVCGYTQEPEQQQQSLSNEFFRAKGRRMLEMELDDEEDPPLIKRKKPTTTTTKVSPQKNQTKLIKPTTTSSSKNQTKLLKPSSYSKNQTKLINPNSLSSKNKTKLIKPTNSTKPISKTTNSTKPSSVLAKKSSDLTQPKNKTTKPTSTAKQSESLNEVKSKNPDKIPSPEKKPKSQIPQKPQKQPIWVDQEDEDDLVSGFRDLPTRFQEQLLPDLERISTTSKGYLTKANKEMTRGFKPYVGNRYASTVASIVSFAFIIIPLLLVSLVVNRIKAYFSIQKLVIFIQVYLSIYFSILCLSSLVTGLEPLKFFYTTSQSTYICLQVLQTLGYVLYLLLLLMYLVLVFGTTESGAGSKVLGLVQTVVGFAVGLHYYVTVFHRVVLHQPPKTNWKVHGIYATCFLVICLLANADRRKKAYLEEGGEEGKKS